MRLTKTELTRRARRERRKPCKHAKIDENRTYAAGLSGGARVAISFALALQGRIAGVVASGAGLPSNAQPNAATPFVLFGAAGVDDFNFPELRQLAEKLDAPRIPNRFEIFNGGHEWLPSELSAFALLWLELQAAKRSAQTPNAALVDELFDIERKRTEAFAAAHEEARAFAEYEKLVADFKGLKETAPFESKINELEKSNVLKSARRREREMDARQRAFSSQILNLSARVERPSERAAGNDELRDAANDLKSLIADLRKKADAPNDNDERRIARRVLNGAFVGAREAAAAAIARRDYADAVSELELASLVRPESGALFYDLAAARAHNGERRKSLDALRAAVAKGFKDRARIETDAAFDSLRREREFQNLLDELQTKR